MRRGSSTWLSRLALALLAVLGFVAPLAAPEADRVVQTSGGKPVQVAPREVVIAAAEVSAREIPVPKVEQAPSPRVGFIARRYLLNHAWLV